MYPNIAHFGKVIHSLPNKKEREETIRAKSHSQLPPSWSTGVKGRYLTMQYYTSTEVYPKIENKSAEDTAHSDNFNFFCYSWSAVKHEINKTNLTLNIKQKEVAVNK